MRLISFIVTVTVISYAGGQNEQAPAVAVLSSPELLQNPTSEFMVVLRESVTPILRELAGRVFTDRGAKLNAIVSTLKAATALSQAPVIAALRPFKVEFQPFWITNKIFIKNGNPAVVKLLQTLPQIKEIRAPRFPSFPPLNPIEGTPPNVSLIKLTLCKSLFVYNFVFLQGTEWNVEIVHAPEVWEMGNDGSGVIVLGNTAIS